MNEITFKKKCLRKGKRERVARKKRFRGSVCFYDKKTAGWLTLKLGHKKLLSHLRHSFGTGG